MLDLLLNLFDPLLWSWKAWLFIAMVICLACGFLVATWPTAIAAWGVGVVLLVIWLWAWDRGD